MIPGLLVFYGGPDQIMGVTSGIATIVGIALMFWNKLAVACGKILNRFRPATQPEEPPVPQKGGQGPVAKSHHKRGEE
jgi:hypothetical protein